MDILDTRMKISKKNQELRERVKKIAADRQRERDRKRRERRNLIKGDMARFHTAESRQEREARERSVDMLRAEIPDDTRDLTGRLMGDPIPGDRRRSGQ
jgi:hypothetical protein